MKEEENKEIIIYAGDDKKSGIQVYIESETIWLSQQHIAQLYKSSRTNVIEHIKNIYKEAELNKKATCQEFRQVQLEGSRKVRRLIPHYNLDMVIALGYRINSGIATRFRQWATDRLHEYIVKGFTINTEKLKNLGGGNYWKELLDEIRDIRSSEKVLYRQVLDLYATAIDYDPKTRESIKFFKIVQNKLHFAAHGSTAAEVIYFRVDSDKPFVGLKHFKGEQPTQAEAMVAKNYLNLKELKVLNNLVSAYFDIAELNAIEHRTMSMSDYVKELDTILLSTRRELLTGSGQISHKKADKKAKVEYRKYKGKILSSVEKDYLESIKDLEKKIKVKIRRK